MEDKKVQSKFKKLGAKIINRDNHRNNNMDHENSSKQEQFNSHSANIEESTNEKKSFFETFIKRPVLSWVINAVIMLVGLVSWNQLSVRELPQISFPDITVKTEFPGAGPSIVESQITIPLEEAFAGIEGLDFMESYSTNGQSTISLHFKSSHDINHAAADVRDRMAKAKDSFPPSLRDPIISKSSINESELIRLVAVCEKYNLAQIADYMQRYIKGTIESIPGVAAVQIHGGGGGADSGAFQIHAIINPEKLQMSDLSVKDVRDAIANSSFKRPLGEILKKGISSSIMLDQSASNVQDYSNIILKTTSKQGLVRLSDVAEVKLMTDDPDSKIRFNGKQCVMVSVIAQQGSNPMETAKNINKQLKDIQKSLPKNLKIQVAYDNSEPIRKSINSVYSSIFEAILFVFLVMLFFLRSWKSTFIPMITIPVCVLGGFFIIYLCGFTINTLTLLAIVLAIGLVVDDAIVVLENIFRHIENGMSPLKASTLGIKEIQFAVIAMTLTLMAVYIPITLSSGLIGKLFIEFAVTLAGTVFISGIVALVLTPMLCSRILTPHGTEKSSHPKIEKWKKKSESFLTNLEARYTKTLDIAINKTKVVIISCVTLGVLGLLVSKYYFPSYLLPETDSGYIVLNLEGPSGATAEYIDKYAQKLEKAIAKIPSIKNQIVSIQSRSSKNAIYISLVDQSKRKKNSKQLLKEITNLIEPVQSGLHIRGYANSGMLGGSGQSEKTISFSIQTQKSYDELELIGKKAIQVIASHPFIDQSTIRNSRIAEEKAYQTKINATRAAQMNVRMSDIGEMLSFILRGQPPADRFENEGKRYPMFLKVSDEFKQDPENIKRFHIRAIKSSNNERQQPPLVSLFELLDIKETTERPLASRYEGMRSFEISFELKKGNPVKIYNTMAKAIDRILPTGYKCTPTRDLRKTINEGNNIMLIFLLSIMFIFLIMAAQFESFIDPLMIMLSVPLALAGGVLLLMVVPYASMNIFTYIALITLIGLITKHGILIIDFANKKFAQKKQTRENLIESIKEAAILRLRPILMTTAAMILGAFPLALSTSSGYEIRSQIGWVIIGGLSVGTLFTIFLIPCVYILVNSYRLKRNILKKPL